jgi:hypothetical protein
MRTFRFLRLVPQYRPALGALPYIIISRPPSVPASFTNQFANLDLHFVFISSVSACTICISYVYTLVNSTGPVA